MNRKRLCLAAIGIVFVLASATMPSELGNVEVGDNAVDTSFTFAAAGDLGWNASTSRAKITLGALQKDLANLSFFIALGDLSYSLTSGTEGAWCDYVKSYVGSSFPFELISGNHEDNDPVRIGNFTACLPDRMGSVGVYGKEFYFDVPSGAPLARIIHISPDLTFPPDVKWKYAIGDVHYRWLIKAIDGARAAGIRWVIVAMHEPCIDLTGSGCSITQDLLDALLDKKVDLVLQAHAHSYQRSKQLTCAPRSMGALFPECIVDADGNFTKGAGSVIAIVATGGQGYASISATDGDWPYFATGMGYNTPGVGWGYLRVTVTASQLTASTRLSGTYQDSFVIGG